MPELALRPSELPPAISRLAVTVQPGIFACVAPVLVFLLGTLFQIFAPFRRSSAAFYIGGCSRLAIHFEDLHAEERFSPVGASGDVRMGGGCVAVGNRSPPVEPGERLYPPVFAYDLNLRTEVIHGLALRGLPAVNPLFFPGHTVALRYHYFWLMPCAMVERVSGGWVNSRQSLIAADVWCGWALMAMVVLYLPSSVPRENETCPAGRSRASVCSLLRDSTFFPICFSMRPIV